MKVEITKIYVIDSFSAQCCRHFVFVFEPNGSATTTQNYETAYQLLYYFSIACFISSFDCTGTSDFVQNTNVTFETCCEAVLDNDTIERSVRFNGRCFGCIGKQATGIVYQTCHNA